MVRTLYLLRHAKAEDSHGDDHARALTPKGLRQCALLAEKMKERSCAVDMIIASDAMRTHQTAEQIVSRHISKPLVIEDASLYLATPGEIIKAIAHAHRPTCENLMIVGHNPGIAELIGILSKGANEAALRSLSRGFSPCSLAVCEVAIDSWEALEPGCGHLREIL